jgi:hypothetical protein
MTDIRSRKAPALHEWARRFAALRPVTLQFRGTADGAVCLETNARFSGHHGDRHLFGYRDAALTFRHFLFNEPIEPGPIARGMVVRPWHDIDVPDLDWKTARAATTVEGGSVRLAG